MDEIINKFCFTSQRDQFVYAPTNYYTRDHSVRICPICKKQHNKIFFLKQNYSYLEYII